ncbi:hypothetical protein Thiosp_00864 [Thiorhodovibrio litoralis]|jgi:hypothetical protein|nr:hypothetical protein Thiosp_00864 [Thiorhodovibrio litoralis]
MSLEALSIINERLEQTVKQEEDVDFRHSQSNQRTQLIGRVASIIMLVLTPPVFYLIWTLVGAMGVITERMGNMYGEIDAMQEDFSQVALHVSTIDTAVGRMRDHMSVMPPLEIKLRQMRGDIDLITGAMGDISPNVSGIGETVGGIDHNMIEMNQAFGLLNRDMFIMRRNVNQMSSPMRMMPFFGQ